MNVTFLKVFYFITSNLIISAGILYLHETFIKDYIVTIMIAIVAGALMGIFDQKVLKITR